MRIADCTPGRLTGEGYGIDSGAGTVDPNFPLAQVFGGGGHGGNLKVATGS